MYLFTAQANQNSTAIPAMEGQAVSNPTYELDSRQVDIEDINLGTAEEDYSKYRYSSYLTTSHKAFQGIERVNFQ